MRRRTSRPRPLLFFLFQRASHHLHQAPVLRQVAIRGSAIWHILCRHRRPSSLHIRHMGLLQPLHPARRPSHRPRSDSDYHRIRGRLRTTVQCMRSPQSTTTGIRQYNRRTANHMLHLKALSTRRSNTRLQVNNGRSSSSKHRISIYNNGPTRSVRLRHQTHISCLPHHDQRRTRTRR